MGVEVSELGISPLGHEQHYWTPDERSAASRAQRRAQTGPYLSTLPASLASISPQFSADLAADIEDGTTSLLAFDLYAMARLGYENPALGPMSAILLRTESSTSSHIEQLTTGAKQLALAEIGETTAQNALAVTGNVRAMEAAVRLSQNINEATVLAMHHELLQGQVGGSVIAGQLREELVWVGGSSAGPIGAAHIAPQSGLVRAALADLFAFADRDDMPVLAQVALTHAQFETIHPFADGNGRTGRALAQAMLRNKQLVQHTTVPLSAGLLRDIDPYFAALTAFREGDGEPIIRQFATAARFAATSGMELVNTLQGEVQTSRELLSGLRSDAAALRVLPRLIAQPVINVKYLLEHLGMNEKTAQRALAQLADAGVLVERSGRERRRVWQHERIIAALDDYAASIRRDGGRSGR